MKKYLALALLALLAVPAAAVRPPQKNAPSLDRLDTLPTPPASERRHVRKMQAKAVPHYQEKTGWESHLLTYLKNHPEELGLSRTPDLRIDYVHRVNAVQGLSGRVYVNLVQIAQGVDVEGTGVSFSFNPALADLQFEELHVRLYPDLKSAQSGPANKQSARDRIQKRTGSSLVINTNRHVRWLRGQWRTVEEFAIQDKGLRGAVDGDGQTYVWDDRVYATYSGTASGRQINFDPVTTGANLQSVPLPQLQIADGVGTPAYTNTTGGYSFTTTGTGAITVGLAGRWSAVADQDLTNLTLTIANGSPNPNNLPFNPTGNIENATAQVNAYRHVTLIHDWLNARGINPVGIDAPIPTKVNVNSTCNAYYDYSSVNFFKSGGGCINTAYDTVVYHEYGHFVDDKIGGITESGLSEGWGDVMATYITGQPIIGESFYGTVGSYIRNANNSYIYNAGDEVHTEGQAWMGFAWDLRTNLIASLGQTAGVSLAENLVLQTLWANSPDIPSAVRAVALLDDNDGNLSNGTPHWAAIQAAASHHGLLFALDAAPPTAPTNVHFASPTANSLQLAWNAATDDVAVTSYKIDVSSVSSFLPLLISYNNADVGNVTAVTINGLNAGTTYYARVRATDAASNLSSNSGTAQGVTFPADVTPPIVSILTPAAGATLSNTVTVSGTASDNQGVSFVAVLVDGSLMGTAVGTTSWSYALNTWLLSNGPHTLTIRAIDLSSNARDATRSVQVTNIGGATFSSALLAPQCLGSLSTCNSNVLLTGRGFMGPEPNQPNTLLGSCADGVSGTFHSDESLDQLSVYTLDGLPFAPGKVVRIEATVWVYTAQGDYLDLFYAANASSPTWTYLTTLTPASAGSQVLSSTYTLPAGSLQAVRGQFRFGGAVTPCSTGSYDDHDDLIFQTGGADVTPPTAPTNTAFANPTTSTLALSWTAATDNFGVVGYRVDVSTQSNFAVLHSSYSNRSVGNVTVVMVTDLNAGTTYYARVRAIDAALNISSNSVAAKAWALPLDTILPTTPTNVIFSSPTLTTLQLTWSPSTDNVGVVNYVVSITNDPTFTSYSNGILGTQTSYVFTSLQANTTYYARVRARDAAQNLSAFSLTATAHTLAPDVSSPTVSISAPATGATIANVYTLRGTAADNRGVSQVTLQLDNLPLGVAIGTGTWTYPLDSWTVSNGSHTLTAQATDLTGNFQTTSRSFNVSNIGKAVYNSTYTAPACTGSLATCNSGILLQGRATITNGPETHQPNTLRASPCADGPSGTFHADESLDRLRVYTLDGQAFAPGKVVRIEATVWAFTTNGYDVLELYYAPNVSSPTWVYLTSLVPQATGAQVLSSTYTLPNAGVLQAVRGTYRYAGVPGACTTGTYDDHDDLVFQVKDSSAPSVPANVIFSSPTANTLRLSWKASTDNAAVSGYRVDVSTSAAFLPFLAGYQNRAVGNVTSLSLSGLTPLTTYYARVRAYDAAVNTSASSLPANARTKADTTPPTLTFFPATGSIVPGVTTTLSAVVSDNIGIAKVEFYINGSVVSSSLKSPYSYRWNTNGLSGTRTLMAKAYDTSGNTLTRSSTVTISTSIAAALNAVGGAYMDTAKLQYEGDAFFSGGSSRVVASSVTITGTSNQAIYRTQRSSTTPFSYAIPLPNGAYTVTLKFAELSATTTGVNVFKVVAETQTVINNLDVYAKVGKFAVYDTTFTLNVNDGVLNLSFQPVNGTAFVNAMQVKRFSAITSLQTSETTPAPWVAITTPTAGTPISGLVSVSANALGSTSVEFYVDGKLKATSSLSPYGFIWDTRGENEGIHLLQAKAFGPDLQTSISTHAVIVANTTAATSLPAGGGSQTTPQASIGVSASNFAATVHSLEAARIYPNPWRADRNTGGITFDQMPLGSTVKIFTIAGQWMKTLSAPNGSVAWDRRNDAGDTAATGIYYYLITDPQGQQTHGQFAIVR